MLTLLHIASRLFELFSKEARVKKQPGRPLRTKLKINKEEASSILFIYR